MARPFWFFMMPEAATMPVPIWEVFLRWRDLRSLPSHAPDTCAPPSPWAIHRGSKPRSPLPFSTASRSPLWLLSAKDSEPLWRANLRISFRTTALVLVSAVTAPLNAPPLGSPTDYATMRFSQRPLADSLGLSFDFTTIGTPEEKSTWVTSILDDPSQSEYFESLLDTLIPTSPRAKGLQNDLLQAPTISLDHLKEIQTPTLIVHGQKNKLVPFAQAEAAASLLNHALFLPLPDAGHIIFLGNAARGAQARITEFLQNHIPSNSPSSR